MMGNLPIAGQTQDALPKGGAFFLCRGTFTLTLTFTFTLSLTPALSLGGRGGMLDAMPGVGDFFWGGGECEAGGRGGRQCFCLTGGA